MEQWVEGREVARGVALAPALCVDGMAVPRSGSRCSCSRDWLAASKRRANTLCGGWLGARSGADERGRRGKAHCFAHCSPRSPHGRTRAPVQRPCGADITGTDRSGRHLRAAAALTTHCFWSIWRPKPHAHRADCRGQRRAPALTVPTARSSPLVDAPQLRRLPRLASAQPIGCDTMPG